MADHPRLFGMAIDEETALVVTGGQVQVLGQGAVVLILAGAEKTSAVQDSLQLREMADLSDWPEGLSAGRQWNAVPADVRMRPATRVAHFVRVPILQGRW